MPPSPPSHAPHASPVEKDAEESHTAVGVHRLAPRPGEPMEPMGGRGVLEQNRTNSSRRGREGEYELVPTRGEDGLMEDRRGGVSEAVGIRRVVEG